MFRLQINIDLSDNEEESLKKVDQLIQLIGSGIKDNVVYRMFNSEDRRAKNYLIKDENGHVTNQWCHL